MKARWAGYFEELYCVSPPSRVFSANNAVPLLADPIYCEIPSVDERRYRLRRLFKSRLDS